MAVADTILRSNRFRIDSTRRVLWSDGKPVVLQSRAFDILDFLIKNRDRYVTRDEIEAHVWRGLTVAGNNLTVQMSALRRALVDCGGGEMIITRPGIGYRFVGTITVNNPEDDQPEVGTHEAAPSQIAALKVGCSTSPQSWFPRRGFWIAVIAAAALLLTAGVRKGFQSNSFPPRLSVVVLPFHNLSGDKAEDYLADAVTDDLTTDLTRIPGSTVIARETADIFRGHAERADEIGRALNVSYLLEGSVEPDDTTVHINAQLIDTSKNAQIWANSFDVPRGKMSNVRDMIAGRLAAELDLELVQVESLHTIHDRPDDIDAIDLFFRARSILDREATLEQYQAAQNLLEKAISKQPDFGDALAELGWLLVSKMTEVDDPNNEVDHAEAKSVISRALAVSPGNTRALSAQGRLYSIDGSYMDAIGSAKAALALQPNCPDAELVLAYAEYYQGHFNEAADPLQSTLRINPEGPSSKLRYLRLGLIRLLQGHGDEAIDLLQRASAGDVNPEPGAGVWGRAEKSRLLLIAAYQLKGDFSTAQRLYANYSRIWLHRTVWRIGALSPRSLSSLPSFTRFLNALHDSGMPMFADENADDHVEPSMTPLTGDTFVSTPMNVPNAQTVNTAWVSTLIHDPRPKLILDVGTGTAAIDGANWEDTAAKADGADSFLERTVKPFVQKFPNRPVVIMGDGAYGIASYNAALDLTLKGYANIEWYRGGEEAWAQHGLPSIYRRLD